MRKSLLCLFVVLAVSAWGESFTLGGAGCGVNTIACTAIPVHAGSDVMEGELSFETIGISNGHPFLSPGLWILGVDGKYVQGLFTSVAFVGYPDPVPLRQEFTFHIILKGNGLSVNLVMHGYHNLYHGSNTNYWTTGGVMTVLNP